MQFRNFPIVGFFAICFTQIIETEMGKKYGDQVWVLVPIVLNLATASLSN
jgi:hypothetical protein